MKNIFCNIFSRHHNPAIFLSLFLLAGLLRFPLLNPPSLWVDDLWASLVAKADTLKDFLLATSHTPILLSLITKAAGSIVPDKEIGPQLFPFLAGCISTPLFYFASMRAANSGVAATAGALMLAFNPMSITYASRVKPYAMDMLAAIILIFFMLDLLSSKTSFSYRKFTFFCCISLLLSFTSLIIITAFYINWGIFLLLHKRRGEASSFLQSAGLFSIFALLYYSVFLKQQMNPTNQWFWSKSFIPETEALNFVFGRIQKILQTALNFNIFLLAFFLLLSIYFLLKKTELSFLVSFYLSIYAVAISLAALKLYPLAAERTDLYLLPFNILFLTMGFSLLEGISPYFLKKCILFFVLIGLFLQYKGSNVKYPNCEYSVDDIKPLVKILEKEYKNGDAIVCWPHANWGLGYYTTWGIRFTPTNQFTNGFAVSLKHPHFFPLNDNIYHFDENASVLKNISRYYNRIWFIASFYESDVGFLFKILDKSGFNVSVNYTSPGAFLRLYEG